jgi:hypothetical protein
MRLCFPEMQNSVNLFAYHSEFKMIPDMQADYCWPLSPSYNIEIKVKQNILFCFISHVGPALV